MTPPKLASAEVATNGRYVTLTFNEDLDFSNGNTPRASAFTFKVDGAVETVAGIGLDSNLKRVRLNLPTAVKIGQNQVVTVSYAVLDSRNIRDLAGNDALPFTDRPVTNNSTVANTSPPVLAGAEVEADGGGVILTFNEALGFPVGHGFPPVDAFTVKAEGAVMTVQEVFQVTAKNKQLRLQLPAAAIKEGQTVTVSYAVPDDNPLQDADGNPAEAFTDVTVRRPGDWGPAKLWRRLSACWHARTHSIGRMRSYRLRVRCQSFRRGRSQMSFLGWVRLVCLS